METDDYWIEALNLKSARRKKRMQKWGRQQQLRKLDDELDELYEQKRELGYIELPKPIEAGWVRYFVLRDDIARSKDAAFYQKVLDKINTKTYCSRRDFLKKSRKTKKLNPVEQHTMYLSKYQFDKCGFTAKEAELFEYKVKIKNGVRYKLYAYVNEWHFQFKIRKHFITKLPVHNNVLQQRIGEIEKYMERNNLMPQLKKLHGYSRNSWHYGMREEERQRCFDSFWQEELDALKKW